MSTPPLQRMTPRSPSSARGKSAVRLQVNDQAWTCRCLEAINSDCCKCDSCTISISIVPESQPLDERRIENFIDTTERKEHATSRDVATEP